MIIDPDFLDHWKTQLLIDSLDDEAAPLYVIRLWAHCQNRRETSFPTLSPRALKALCRYSGHPDKLWSCLVESGFATEMDCGGIEVLNWGEYNAQLIANWTNGKKGGRPRKNPKPPPDSPVETHQKPMGNPSQTDKSREDGMGEDEKISGRESACVIPESLDSKEFRETWELYRSWWLSNTGKRLDDIRALQQLGILRDRGSPEKAIADLKLTMASSTKPGTIWDSGRQAGRNGEPKRKRRSVAEMLED